MATRCGLHSHATPGAKFESELRTRREISLVGRYSKVRGKVVQKGNRPVCSVCLLLCYGMQNRVELQNTFCKKIGEHSD